jgi:hypothetical protein
MTNDLGSAKRDYSSTRRVKNALCPINARALFKYFVKLSPLVFFYQKQKEIFMGSM